MSDNKNEIVVKKRHRGNPALTGDAITATPNETAAIIRQSLTIANWERIDVRDAEQVQNRINKYFELVMGNGNRPTVAGLALSLGMDRARLYEIKTGNYGNTRGYMAHLPENVTACIKNAYRVLEELMENYMETGKINPVAGIFLQKNHFGYQDKQDIVVTPNNAENDYSAKDIAERYLIEEGDKHEE